MPGWLEPDGSAALSAKGFPAHCAGTYLMAEDGGATSLWTFEADGAFFATSSLDKDPIATDTFTGRRVTPLR